jgi:serine/threonine-protein kinase
MTTGQAGVAPSLLEQRYRVDEAIARGGMSTVYRGTDLRLQRPVAIKVMDPAFASDAQFLSRFEFEARAAARLRNPGIVAVYDQGREGDHVFLVMELVDGGTLRELLHERGPMPPHAVRAAAEPVLDALAAAHRGGLAHRDVKPENVLISETGEVKIADFGLVRAIGSASITANNVVLGTAAYLAPEQIRDGTSDARSDVYAFGVMVFEMLTGTVPFTGDSSVAVAYQRLDKDVPPPSSRISGVPPEFDELVAVATARDPDRRFADAGAMLTRLREIAATLKLPPYRVPAPGQRPGGTNAMTAVAPQVPATRQLQPRRPEPPTMQGPAMTKVDMRPGLIPPPPAAAPIPVPRQRRPWLLWVVGVVILALALGVGGWLLAAGDTATVPSVDGMNQTQALATLRQAGFATQLRTTYSDSRAPGNVLGTDPAAGSRTAKGSTVALLISGGQPSVPQFSPGADPDTVRGRIRAMNLIPADGGSVYSSAASGTVAQLDPTPGTVVPVGSQVKVILSRGAASSTMPDLTGESVQDASAKITGLGAKVGTIVDQSGSPATAGQITATDPAAGAGIGPDTAVNLTVSSTVKVPFVLGSSVNGAKRHLERLGFKVIVTHQLFPGQDDNGPGDPGGFGPGGPDDGGPPDRGGVVDGQSLPAGSDQPSGSTITLTVFP